jgi:hypothetical protein
MVNLRLLAKPVVVKCAWVVDFYKAYVSSEAGPERLNWSLGFEMQGRKGKQSTSVTLTDQCWGATAPPTRLYFNVTLHPKCQKNPGGLSYKRLTSCEVGLRSKSFVSTLETGSNTRTLSHPYSNTFFTQSPAPTTVPLPPGSSPCAGHNPAPDRR